MKTKYPGIAGLPRESDRTSQRKFTDAYPTQGIPASPLVQGDGRLPPRRVLKHGPAGESRKENAGRDGRQVLPRILVPGDKDGQR